MKMMSRIQTFCFILWMSAYCAQGDKYTDENRPYEFGFTIEGEQHRHEKKDENGIIMGEFGFITADGVYHVTVYATDENGNFKILSMKNIRVKPYPTGPTQNIRQGHSLQLPSSHQSKTNEETKSSAQNIKQELNPGPAKTCSHCSVPTTTTQSPKLSNEKPLKNYNKQQENEYNTNIQSNTNSFTRNNQDYNTQEKTQNKQKLSDSFNKKQFTSNDQTVTGQVYSENFNSKQPSREISTPFISNYPQNSDIRQNVPQEEKKSFVNYPQTYENSPQVPKVVSQYSQGSSPLNFNTEEPRSETLGQTGIGQTEIVQTAIGQTEVGQTGIVQTGIGEAEIEQPEIRQPEIGQTIIGQTEVGQTGIVQTGIGEAEIGQPETRQPEIGQTESGHTIVGVAGIEHTGISQTGNLPENNNFISNKFKTKSNGEDEKLSNINKANDRPNTILPQNSINAYRQPKSFNDILESVNPELEYSNAVQPQGSLQPGFNNLPKKPVLVAAQMEIVDRNTDIYHKNPGEKDGLPQGLTSTDMKQLLYTFNYTLGFHGHHEEGYTNGAKYGYYFVTGRNGVRTRVDYTADETGFHPKISQEVLDILSDDVPKPETEKDEKYGLRGYEFKWLYYPVDSP